MFNPNQGHGICGAKNIYSSKSKLNNYVEDRIGAALASRPRPGNVNYETVTKASFKHPNEQPPLPSVPLNMPTTQELKVKNKDGMSYSMLFEHGLKDIGPEVQRYRTLDEIMRMICLINLHNVHIYCRIDTRVLLL